MSYLENTKDSYQQIYSVLLLQAFEQYCHQYVKMTESTGDTCEGKYANRKRKEQFVASIKEMHGGGIGSITSDEDNAVTTVESWMDVTFQDGNRVKMEQVAVQGWQDGQIINERFYYNHAIDICRNN